MRLYNWLRHKVGFLKWQHLLLPDLKEDVGDCWRKRKFERNKRMVVRREGPSGCRGAILFYTGTNPILFLVHPGWNKFKFTPRLLGFSLFCYSNILNKYISATFEIIQLSIKKLWHIDLCFNLFMTVLKWVFSLSYFCFGNNRIVFHTKSIFHFP